jgi:CRP-like cAMP-binding protein
MTSFRTYPPLPEREQDAVLATLAGLAPEHLACSPHAFVPLLPHMRFIELGKAEALLRVGDPGDVEAVVLSGLLRSWVGDSEGRAVTLGFHAGPCALPPAITRSSKGRSRLHCEALGPAKVVLFPEEALAELMQAEPKVQSWGDHILRTELIRRADREWGLAALPARQRLLWLREQFPALEEQVPHHHIASHLGITPVSFSRLRAQLR